MSRQPVTVELFYDGAWQDHTTATDNHNVDGTLTRNPISIVCGRGATQTEPTPNQADLLFLSKTGRYSPYNAQSDLYGKINRSTPLRVRLDTPTQDIVDTFSRTAVNTWSSADSGQAYSYVTAGGGSVNDFDVAAGSGTHLISTANGYRLALLAGVLVENGEAVLIWKLPVADVTGASLEPANIAVRAQSTTSYYLFRVGYTTAEQLTAQIYDPTGAQIGTTSAISASGLPAGEVFKTRIQFDGPVLRMRTWRASTSEPATWHAEAVDYRCLDAGGVGIRSGAANGNTNVPVTFTYDDFALTSWSIRFTGEASWKPNRAIGAPGQVDVTAFGVLQRIQDGTKPLESPLYRAYSRSDPIAWWPLEAGDGRVTTTSPSGLVGGDVLIAAPGEFQGRQVSGVVGGSVTGPAGALRATDTSQGGQLSGPVPFTASTTDPWRFETSFLIEQPMGASDTAFVATIMMGNATVWFFAGGPDIPAGGDPGGTFLEILPANGGPTLYTDTTTPIDDGAWHHLRIDCTPSGGQPSWELAIDGVVIITGTTAGATFAQPNFVILAQGGTVGVTAMSATAFWRVTLPDDLMGYEAFTGHAGETVAARMARLCAEQGIAFTLIGNAVDTPAMGPQPSDTFSNILAEGERTDMGLLGDMRQARGLQYRTRRNMYNQTTKLALSYVAGGIGGELQPDVSGQSVRNDVTVKRADGETGRAVQTSGPNNVNDPGDDPDGVGIKDISVGANPLAVADLTANAQWRRAIGTVEDARFPQATVDLAAAPYMVDTVNTMRHGDAVTIDDIFDHPDQVAQLAVGWAEVIGTHTRDVTYNTVPSTPYRVFVLGDASLGRLADNGTSTLTAAESTSDTSWSVTTTSPTLWSTADEPYDVRVGGEVATATVVTGAASPQTFTVTRSVNGVVKAHAAGDTVTLAHPNRLAL